MPLRPEGGTDLPRVDAIVFAAGKEVRTALCQAKDATLVALERLLDAALHLPHPKHATANTHAQRSAHTRRRKGPIDEREKEREREKSRVE